MGVREQGCEMVHGLGGGGDSGNTKMSLRATSSTYSGQAPLCLFYVFLQNLSRTIRILNGCREFVPRMVSRRFRLIFGVALFYHFTQSLVSSNLLPFAFLLVGLDTILGFVPNRWLGVFYGVFLMSSAG